MYVKLLYINIITFIFDRIQNKPYHKAASLPVWKDEVAGKLIAQRVNH